MYNDALFPIIEFDENKTAKLNPSAIADRPFPVDKLVITLFPEVIEKLISEKAIAVERVISGENPVTVYRFTDCGVLLTLGQVGCPACGGNLDLFNALGAAKVMFCGGGGVLDKSIDVGRLILVEGAIRDEGFSYQYIPASRIIYSDPAVVRTVARYRDENGIPYLKALTWTTDALVRETSERIERRKMEGACIVEMEQAGCIAVAQFRGFAYGALIYGGDDVSQAEWDPRSWRSREGIRYDLVTLCKKLVELI